MALAVGPETGVVGVRPLEAGDVERLRRLFFRLSPATVYLRFFSPVRKPSDAALRHLATVDHDRREALAAVVDDEIVGVARYDRLPGDSRRAEVAIVIEDDWQGRGLGTRLLRELAVVAQRNGVDAFVASVLGHNRRMVSLARRLSPATTASIDHGEWLLEIPLERGGAAPSGPQAASALAGSAPSGP